MPPAISENSFDSEGEDIIPERKPKQKAIGKRESADPLQEDAANGEESDDDDDEGADEYVPEKIIDHIWDKDTVLYQVKWAGYGDDEMTYEPLINLETAPKIVNAYHKKIGGPPARDTETSKGSKTKNKKRKGSDAHTESSGSGKAHNKRRKSEELVTTLSGSHGTKAAWKPPPGSWEDHISSVDTVERSPSDQKLKVFLVWKENHRQSVHPVEVAHRKCPLKLIDFYEAHLQFKVKSPSTDFVKDVATPAAKDVAHTAVEEPVKDVVPSEMKEALVTEERKDVMMHES